MKLVLPLPPPAYDTTDQAQTRRAIEAADQQNQKIGAPVVLKSPDGTRWALSASNAGALSLVKIER